MNRIVSALALLAAVSGCKVTKSPYDYAENWLIREDPVRTFVIPADVIYVQNDLYTSAKHLPVMQAYANAEVGRGRFNGVARVFAPLVANENDLELALEWYFRHHHDDGRPFAFIGEGRGGELLRAYEVHNAEKLAKQGLVESFYTDAANKGFVTDAMVKAIKHGALESRYKSTWKRDMPKGMLSE